MSIIESLRQILLDNMKVETSVVTSLTRPVTTDWLGHMAAIKPSSSSLRDRYERIMTLASRAEKECPRAGQHFIDLVVHGRSTLPRPRVLRTIDDLTDLLVENSRSSRAIEVIQNVIDECDDTTRILMKRSKVSQVRIETEIGCRVECVATTSDFLMDDDVYVACIDGFIETVAEIHEVLSFLSGDSRSGQPPKPCVIFARGASQDVITTLHANFLSGRLRIVCLVVEWKAESVNGLADASLISGAEMISVLRGDVVASLTPKRLGVIARCETSRTGAVMYPQLERQPVVSRKSSLLADDDSSLSRDRSTSLSTRTIVVDVPDDHVHDSLACDVDFGIRCLMGMMRGESDPLMAARRQYMVYERILSGDVYVDETGVTFES